MVLNNQNALLSNLHFKILWGTQTIFCVHLRWEDIPWKAWACGRFTLSPQRKRSCLLHILREVLILLSGGWKAMSCSDALHYLLSRQTRASDGILLHPVLFFPALKDYQNDKYALVSCCFQNSSFRKLTIHFTILHPTVHSPIWFYSIYKCRS